MIVDDKKALLYVEVDIDRCSRTYGVAPCTAAIPTTGTRKCFNSLGTCQDRINFNNTPVTYRFAQESGYLPDSIECIPCIAGISVTPAVVSLGKDLGQRASVTIQLMDHPHSDAGPNFDKYPADRAYDPFKKGSFFGKFRARNPYLRGRACRVITGFLGQTLAEMKTQHFIIDSFSGPDSKGRFTLVCKDILKLADNDIAKAPALSPGYLNANISSASRALRLDPVGAGVLYPQTGYVAIGGEEICRFAKDPGTTNSAISIFLRGEGANGSATITDSGPKAKTSTAGGNAVNSTGAFKFGAGSYLFDGTGDYIQLDGSADFAFGTGDFTIEFWVNFTAIGVQKVLYDSRPAGGTGLYPLIYVSATNFLQYNVNGVNVIGGATAVTAAAWHHVAVSRVSGVTRMFLNGVQQGNSYSDANNYINGASRPILGASGNTLGNESLNGRLDEIRVLKGLGLFGDSAATFPLVAYTDASWAYTMHLVRAQYETIARDHQIDDRVQLCLRYVSADPADIMYDLLANYASIPAAYLPLAAWKSETSNYLQRTYTTLIAEPTGVNQLLSELAEQAAMAIWWDEFERIVRMQVLRPIPTTAFTFDSDIILEDSIGATDQPTSRISEVWTFFGQRNPLLKLDERKNYRSAVANVDLQSETDYGTSAIKQIFSRWIPAFGRTTATRLNNIILGRFRDPPRNFKFELLIDNDGNILTGGGYQLKNYFLQDDTGDMKAAPIQVTRIARKPDRLQIEAEEMLFKSFGLDDPNNRVIIVDSNTTNFNLRTVHDTLFPVITVPTGITVKCIIEEDAIVGSNFASIPAFNVGSWVAGLTIIVEVRGRIQGKGGNAGTISGTTATNGEAGGTGLYTRYPISVLVASGEIWGGGGGGGASKYNNNAPGNYIAGGGGGAGYFGGTGGLSVGGLSGQSGSTSAGGNGSLIGGIQKGGNGGGPGLAGQSGQHTPAIQNGTGGAAGNSIDGVSYITFTTGPGDRRGAEVN